MSVQIQKMTIDNYKSAYQLWTATPGMGLRSLDDSPEGIARYLARNPETCFVAVQGESVVGTILCGHDGRRGFIYHTAVAAAFQRSGIGTALVDAAIDALKKQGIHKVALVTFRSNESGNRFWADRGFADRTDLVYRDKSLLQE